MHSYPPQQVIVHNAVVTVEQQRLAEAQRKLKNWSKCQVYSGYAWVFFNAISVLCNAFLILVMFNWHDITFFDNNGAVHNLRLNPGGLIFLTLLKILACVLCVKWGIEAIKTFKPIIQAIEREQLQGVQQPDGHIHDSQSKSIKAHKKKVVKILGLTFLTMVISILYGKSYASRVTMKFIDDEYDIMESRNSYPSYEP